MYQEKAKKISRIINDYFEGVYAGNVELLKSSFHSNAFLYGDISGNEYLRSFNDYLEGVKNRKSPKESDEENKMKILSLEILGDVAIAKIHLPMLGYNYHDFLSLAVVNNEWKIVNKIFTHVE